MSSRNSSLSPEWNPTPTSKHFNFQHSAIGTTSKTENISRKTQIREQSLLNVKNTEITTLYALLLIMNKESVWWLAEMERVIQFRDGGYQLSMNKKLNIISFRVK